MVLKSFANSKKQKFCGLCWLYNKVREPYKEKRKYRVIEIDAVGFYMQKHFDSKYAVGIVLQTNNKIILSF